MALPGDNHGSVSVLVTTDTSNVRAEISSALTRPFKTSVEVSKSSLSGIRKDIKEALAAPFKISVELNRASATRVRAEIKDILAAPISINVKLSGDGKQLLAQVQKVEKQRVAVSLASDKTIQRNREKSLQKLASLEKTYQNRRKLLIQQDVNNENASNRSREGEAAKSLERRARNEQLFRNKSALEAQRLNNRLVVIATQADAKLARVGSNSSGLLKFGENVQRVSSSLNGFERVTSRVLSTSLLAVTGWSAGVVAGFTAVGVAALKAVIDVEQSASRAAGAVASAKVAAEIAKNGKATSDFGKIAASAQIKITQASTKIGLNTLFNTKQVSEGILSLVQSGQSLGDAITNVNSAARAASVSGEDLGRASEGLAAGLAASGLQAKDSAGLLDKFQFVANDTLGNVGDVTDAFANKSASSFRAYKKSVDETLLVLDLFGKTGIKGATAGTDASIVIRDLDKAIGKNGDSFNKYGIRIADARHKNVTLVQTLTDLARVFGSLDKTSGSRQRLIKDLGFQSRSFQFLAQLFPQIQSETEKGLNLKLNLITTGSKGSVDQQFSLIKKQLFFQIQQFQESFTAVFLAIGQSFAPALSKAVDGFAGNEGLIAKTRPALVKFGAELGKVIAKFAEFAHSKQFIQGVKLIADALVVTIRGVAEAGKQLGASFGETKKGQSAFVGFAKAVHAFAEFSAATLPKVARVIGEIINFLISHKDAFAAFAQGAVYVLVLKKAFDIFVSPALAAAKALGAVSLAMTELAATEGGVTAAGGLTSIAGALGLIDKEALAAKNSMKALRDQAIATQAATSATQFAALQPARGAAREGAQIATQGLGAGAAGAGIAQLGGDKVLRASKGFAELGPAITEATASFGEFAAAASIAGGVLAAIPVAIAEALGFFSGFTKEIRHQIDANKDLATGLGAIGDAFGAVGSAISSFLAGAKQAGEFFGAGLAKALGRIAHGIGEIARAFSSNSIGGFIEGILGGVKDLALGLVTVLIPELATASGALDHFKRKIGDLGAGLLRDIGFKGAASEIDRFGEKTVKVTDAIEVATRNLISGAGKNIGDLERIYQRLGNSSTLAARRAVQSAIAIAASARAASQALVTEKLTQKDPSLATDLLLGTNATGRNKDKRLNQQLIDSGVVISQLKGLDSSLVGTTSGAGQGAGGGIPGLGDGTKASKATKAIQTAAEKAKAAVDKLTAAQFKGAADSLIAKVQRLPGVYKATAFQAEILSRALPSIDAALQKQRDQVTKLTDALTKLQSTQLKGTKAAADAAFGFDQDVKKLQLQKLDLQIAGVKDEDPRIKALDDQINAIQLKSERAATAASIALDPLKKKLEDTFTPVKELSFDQIISQFNTLNNQKIVLDAKVSRGDALKAKLDAVVAAAADKFADVGLSVTKGINVGLKAGQDSVAKASASTANTIKSTIDAGLGIASPSKEMIRRGINVTQGLTIGIVEGRPAVLQAMRSLNFGMLTVIDNALPLYTLRGTSIMNSFLAGIKAGFGTKKDVGTVAWYLGTFIPQWIIDNKGPIEADRQLLVPAGEAVMHGFGKGLRSGFGQIQGFVKDVGPSLSEFISKDAFSDRTATFMADIAVGKTPDIDALFGDLQAGLVPGLEGFIGPIDPSLAFLHPTESLADTTQMAQKLAQLFGLQVTATTNGHHAVGSQHYVGQAADLSNSSGGGDNTASNTPQMLALARALAPFQGSVVKQLIYQNRDWRTGARISGHQNHDHVGFQPAGDFSEFSGKIGKSRPTALTGLIKTQGPLQEFRVGGEPEIVARAINAAANKYRVSAALLTAIVKDESGFRSSVISGDGGYGLFQLTNSSLKRQAGANILNPFVNADVGTKFFADLLRRNHGNVFNALENYNGDRSGAYARRVLGFLQSFGGFRERGGPVGSGTPYIVGERGPELFIPRSNGTVLSNTQTSQALSSSSGQINYAPNITVNTAATDPRVTADLIDIYSRRQLQGVLR